MVGQEQGGLRPLWAGWLRLARAVGLVVTTVLLVLFYFTLFVPFALAYRLSGDALRLRQAGGRTAWLPRAPRASDLQEGRRAY